MRAIINECDFPEELDALYVRRPGYLGSRSLANYRWRPSTDAHQATGIRFCELAELANSEGTSQCLATKVGKTPDLLSVHWSAEDWEQKKTYDRAQREEKVRRVQSQHGRGEASAIIRTTGFTAMGIVKSRDRAEAKQRQRAKSPTRLVEFEVLEGLCLVQLLMLRLLHLHHRINDVKLR